MSGEGPCFNRPMLRFVSALHAPLVTSLLGTSLTLYSFLSASIKTTTLLLVIKGRAQCSMKANHSYVYPHVVFSSVLAKQNGTLRVFWYGMCAKCVYVLISNTPIVLGAVLFVPFRLGAPLMTMARETLSPLRRTEAGGCASRMIMV